MEIIKIITKLMYHTKYNSMLNMNKKKWKDLGFEDNDNIKVIKLEEGKFLVEKII
jgi:formylmethanofuran dehydrogenase subunit D